VAPVLVEMAALPGRAPELELPGRVAELPGRAPPGRVAELPGRVRALQEGVPPLAEAVPAGGPTRPAPSPR
jgi:hypothetical protein